MDYTIEQKAVALLTNTLWWRYPESVSGAQVWTRLRDDFAEINLDDVQAPGAEYHIGDEPPKPPRVLSELERELADALETLCNRIEFEGASPLDWPSYKAARNVLSKVWGEA